MSYISPIEWNMANLIGMRRYISPSDSDKKSDDIWADEPDFEIEPSLSHATLLSVYGRWNLRKSTNVDFKFDFNAWHIHVESNHEYKYGMLPWAESETDLFKSISEQIGSFRLNKLSKSSSILWNCLDKKNLLEEFVRKRKN